MYSIYEICQAAKLIIDKFFILVLVLIIIQIILICLIYSKSIVFSIVFSVIFFLVSMSVLIMLQRCYKRALSNNVKLENEFNKMKDKLEEHIMELNVSNNELKMLNIELIKAKNRLEELSNYRGRFISNMSHELRTPLNAIIGFSHILLESDFVISEEEKINLIKVIHNSGKRLLNIINNILDLSDLRQDLYEPTPKIMDITPTIDAMASTAKGLLKDKTSIILSVNTDGKYPRVYADEVALNKVLTHVIENASKYTSKGEIRIFTEEDENYFYIMVSDTGIGMTKEELERVFEPFTKMIMNDQPISLTEGVGLGMPVSKYLMDKMSEDLLVTSQKGYGTTVKVMIKKGTEMENLKRRLLTEIKKGERVFIADTAKYLVKL